MDLIWANYSLTQANNPGLLKLATANTSKFVVKSNGNVGIGVSTPLYTFDLVGTGRVNGQVIWTSDERLKDNIIGLKDASSSILKLNGVTYNFKYSTEDIEFEAFNKNENIKDSIKMRKNEAAPEFYNRKHIGFRAQEIQNVFPELVFEDSLGILSIDYIGLIPVLVEALKEQDKQINEQNTKVKNLESRVSALESILNNTTKKSSSINSSNVTDPIITDTPSLSQNTPNPFGQKTEISFFLPVSTSNAMISIYNMSGSPVKNIMISTTGKGSIIINGSELQPGMYLYSLIVDGLEIDTKRMILTE